MINLTKDAPRISLAKSDSTTGEMRVNLNWSQPPSKKGFLSGFLSPGTLDLDLGCLYELANGDVGAVQALGNSFGSLDYEPFIELDQDDRSGLSTEGENLSVNMECSSELKRVLVFAFIYEGAPSWDVAKGMVTISPPKGEKITVLLDAPQYKTMCAIAMLNFDKSGVSIQREVKYFDGHADMDYAYSFGLNWVPGTKD
jgi:tellurite resistance protein TerA